LEAVATTGNCIVEILKNGSSIISTFVLHVASTGAQLFQLEYFNTATASTDYFEVRTTSTQDMYVENGSSFSAIRVA
jgi:hypothetical protein